MSTMFNELTTVLTAVASSVVTFLLTRKKYNSEVDLNLMEKMEKSLDFYKNLADDQSKRLDDLTERNKLLEKEVQQLKEQVLSLSMHVKLGNTTPVHKRSSKSNYTEG